MDPLLLTILLRAVERLFIVAAGAGAIYLGYRLFLDMPSRERGSGKIELPGGVSIFLSRVGPGVFFSLFGAAVIALALRFGVSFTDNLGSVAGTSESTRAVADAGPQRKTSYSGVAGDFGGRGARSAETDRVNAAITIRNLNRVLPALRDGLPPQQRLDIVQAVQDAKLRLMRGVWHEPSWGSYARFLAWVQNGEADPPPDEVRNAAAIWRAGATGGSAR